MFTSGIFILLGLGLGVLTFSSLSRLRGDGFAYLAVCWAPLAVLAMSYALRGRLGYSALAMLMAVTVASLVLLALGVVLSARAARTGSPASNRLKLGTVVAAIPALIVIVATIWTRSR